MSKIAHVESYLAKHLDKLDLVIEQVLSLVPDSYFYGPEINQGDFLEMKQSMDELRRKARYWAYQNDSSVQREYKRAVTSYEASLKELARKKRVSLKSELMVETEEMQVACLISLIHHHQLLKHLRTFE